MAKKGGKLQEPNDTRVRKVFKDIVYDAALKGKLGANAKGSLGWFRAKLAKFNRITAEEMMREAVRNKKRLEYGKMYMFVYDAKHKDTLPYWDAFPLIFAVGKAPGGFYGINLHYLPYKFRIVLLDALFSIASDKRFDERTKLKLSYSVLKGASKYKYFQPCLKHYLTGHVESPFMRIEATEWPIAIFLPVERFQKRTKQTVWKHSEALFARSKRRGPPKKTKGKK